VPHVYLAHGPTRSGGNAQRNVALKLIRDGRLNGIVYQLDDDNACATPPLGYFSQCMPPSGERGHTAARPLVHDLHTHGHPHIPAHGRGSGT